MKNHKKKLECFPNWIWCQPKRKKTRTKPVINFGHSLHESM